MVLFVILVAVLVSAVLIVNSDISSHLLLAVLFFVTTCAIFGFSVSLVIFMGAVKELFSIAIWLRKSVKKLSMRYFEINKK